MKDLKEIAQILGVACSQEIQVTGFEIDSRRVKRGHLFFALRGERVDGHNFLEDVAKQGGLAAVVKNYYEGPDYGLILLKVEDVVEALQMLARVRVEVIPAQIIAITGTVGKTTTKEMAAQLLKSKYRVGKSPKNFNTQVGLPLSILNMVGDEEVLVLEMGMSKQGEIAKLVTIAPPDVAVITKISLVHAEFFADGLEGIARAKGEIFSNEKTKKAIVHASVGGYDMPFERCCVQSYSIDDREADLYLQKMGDRYCLDEKGVRVAELDVRFHESHFLENLLGAIAIGRAMKMEWEEIEQKVPELQIPKMRFEKLELNGILYVNDAYNASPESMRAALFNLPKPAAGGKKIGVLGSMRELGSFSDKSHRSVGVMALETLDHLLCIGDECKDMVAVFEEAKKPAEWFSDCKSLAHVLRDLAKKGDVVLVKGSRSLEMEQIFSELGD